MEDDCEQFSDAYLFNIEIPYGLSILANHDYKSFVPGINDIVNGVSVNAAGDTINTVSYAERMARGRLAQQYLRDYGTAKAAKDQAKMAIALDSLKANYPYFGYGYFDNVEEAIPPVSLTYYMFRLMVGLGSYFLLFYIIVLILVYRPTVLKNLRWLQWLAIVQIPFMWLCSEAGWAVAEVGRQPWTVQDLLPTRAAISAVSTTSVVVTFWIFALLFTMLLVAEVSIMCRQISSESKKNLETANA